MEKKKDWGKAMCIMSVVQINILAEFNLVEKLKHQQGDDYEGGGNLWVVMLDFSVLTRK